MRGQDLRIWWVSAFEAQPTSHLTQKQEGRMSRNLILALGALMWGAFALFVIAHAIVGDLAGPIGAVILVAVMLGARQIWRSLPRAS